MILLPRSKTDNRGLLRRNRIRVKNIGASSIQTSTTKYVENLINFSKNYYWCSNNVPFSYFYITFENPIYVTNYTFEVKDWGEVEAYPLNWLGIGVSPNNTEINISRVYNSELNKDNLKRTFKTNNIGPFTALKFVQKGLNLYPNNHFCLAKFDVFGFYDRDLSLMTKCACSHKKVTYLFMYLIIVMS